MFFSLTSALLFWLVLSMEVCMRFHLKAGFYYLEVITTFVPKFDLTNLLIHVIIMWFYLLLLFSLWIRLFFIQLLFHFFISWSPSLPWKLWILVLYKLFSAVCLGKRHLCLCTSDLHHSQLARLFFDPLELWSYL